MKKLGLIFTVMLFTSLVSGQTFSPDWKTVPLEFKGNDFEAIYNYIHQNKLAEKKDKSKTTAQYQAGISDASKVKISPTLTANETLVFVYRLAADSNPSKLAGFTSEYNTADRILNVRIDTRSFKVAKSDLRHNKDALKDVPGTTIKPSIIERLGSYTIQNSYGAKVEAQSLRLYSHYLGITNMSDFKELVNFANRPNFTIKLPMSPEKAKLAKPQLSMLFVVNLVKPYSILGELEIKPTLDKPTAIQSYDKILPGTVKEFWLFNGETGEIYAKLKPSAGSPAKEAAPR